MDSLKFQSVGEACQYLADHTGKKIMIAITASTREAYDIPALGDFVGSDEEEVETTAPEEDSEKEEVKDQS